MTALPIAPTFDGPPHIRDMDAPCCDYRPEPMPTGHGPCVTDGHPLCLGCADHNRAGYDALARLP